MSDVVGKGVRRGRCETDTLVPFGDLKYLTPDLRDTVRRQLICGAAGPAIDVPIKGAGELLECGRLTKRETPAGDELWQVEKTCFVRSSTVKADGTVEIIASDATVDRFGDVIDVAGWDLAAYRNNPVLLVDHDYTVASIVGYAVNARAADGALRITAKLDPAGTNATADMVRQKLESGSLRTVSVGFLPVDWEPIVSAEGSRTGVRFLKSELLEVSFVAVPANPAALIQPAAASGNCKGVTLMSESSAALPAAEGKPDHKIADLVEAQRWQAEQNERMARKMTEIADRGESTDKWIRDIESRLQSFRGRGSSLSIASTDFLRDAIPERFRQFTPRFAASSRKSHRDDPVRANAMSSWLKLAGQLQLRHYARIHSSIALELDKLTLALNGGIETRAAMQEDTPGEGGYAVPAPLEGLVLRALADVGAVRPLVRQILMTSKTLDFPGGDNAVTAAIIAEEGTITESNETFTQRQLVAKKFCAIGTASMELVADASIDVLDYYLELAMEQIALLEDDEALEGDGSTVHFTGVNAASGVNAVASGATDATISANLAAAKFKGPKASRRNAAWIMHSQLAGYLAGVADSNGKPLLNTADVGLLLAVLGTGGNIIGKPEGTILADPVYTSDEITITSGTPDTANAYYGNWQGVIFGDRAGTEFAVSEHTKFTSAQLQPRIIKRTAILVGVPSYLTKLTGQHVE